MQNLITKTTSLLLKNYASGASPFLLTLPNSEFVLVFEDTDGSALGVFARIYNYDGSLKVDTFRVNSFTFADQKKAAAVAFDDNSFVVVWQSESQDKSGKGIYAQMFSNNGVKIRSEFQVNSFIFADQDLPAITILDDNNFVVVWQSESQDKSGKGIYGKIFNKNAIEIGSEFQVNSFTFADQAAPVVTNLNNGNFVVAWQSESQDKSGKGIYGQIFSPDGLRVGGEFQANSFVFADQSAPCISNLNNGNFIVLWHSESQDKSGKGTYGQIFLPDGQKIYGEQQINQYTFSDQKNPEVSTYLNGNFVVTWSGYNGLGSGFAWQEYTQNWTKIGNLHEVNDPVSSSFGGFAAISLPNGGQILSWVGNGGNNGGSISLIVQQNYPENLFETNTTVTIFDSNQTSNFGNGKTIEQIVVAQNMSLFFVYSIQLDLKDNLINCDDCTKNFLFGGEEKIKITRYDAVTKDTYNFFDNDFWYIKSLGNSASQFGSKLMVVWEGIENYGSDNDIFVGEYNLTSGKFLGYSKVNDYTFADQNNPSTCFLKDGTLVIAWQSECQDGSDSGIYAKLFSPDGKPIFVGKYSWSDEQACATTTYNGYEIQVNANTNYRQQHPIVGCLANNEFIVAWESYSGTEFENDIYYQKFNTNGMRIGEETKVNVYSQYNQTLPSISTFTNGSFIITWTSQNQDGYLEGIFARSFDLFEKVAGFEFPVNHNVFGNQNSSKILAISNSSAIISWTSTSDIKGQLLVYAQHVDLVGNKLGSEFLVNNDKLSSNWDSSIAMLENNNYVLSFLSGTNGGIDLLLREFDGGL